MHWIPYFFGKNRALLSGGKQGLFTVGFQDIYILEIIMLTKQLIIFYGCNFDAEVGRSHGPSPNQAQDVHATAYC